VRIAVIVLLGKEQHAAIAHEVDNLWIRFKDGHTREVFNV
jgi:hypothetical protein